MEEVAAEHHMGPMVETVVYGAAYMYHIADLWYILQASVPEMRGSVPRRPAPAEVQRHMLVGRSLTERITCANARAKRREGVW